MRADYKEMLASIYGMAADFKNVLYDYNFLDQVGLSTPVLSVGNLSVGGTGKTPVVSRILKEAESRGLNSAVIARNYRARSRGIHHVQTFSDAGGSFYGDEASLLAKLHPESAVWTGPTKHLTAQAALAEEDYQLLIVDDGFQHRALHRDFDLVLLDCTAPLEEDFLLPKGRLRESFQSLERASAVALTKVNWSTEEHVQILYSRIPQHLEIYEIEFKVSPLSAIEKGASVLAVSGIAKPQVFHQTLRALSENTFDLKEHLIFSDHHDYTEKDADLILKKMLELGCQQILTTEKDLVKLGDFPQLTDHLNPLRVATEFKETPKGLYAFLDQCRRS